MGLLSVVLLEYVRIYLGAAHYFNNIRSHWPIDCWFVFGRRISR